MSPVHQSHPDTRKFYHHCTPTCLHRSMWLHSLFQKRQCLLSRSPSRLCMLAHLDVLTAHQRQQHMPDGWQSSCWCGPSLRPIKITRQGTVAKQRINTSSEQLIKDVPVPGYKWPGIMGSEEMLEGIRGSWEEQSYAERWRTWGRNHSKFNHDCFSVENNFLKMCFNQQIILQRCFLIACIHFKWKVNIYPLIGHSPKEHHALNTTVLCDHANESQVLPIVGSG